MTPAEQAAKLYDEHTTPRSFREDVEAHMLHGSVWSGPSFFMLFRYVNTAWSLDEIDNPWFNPDDPKNCLHCYLACGDRKEFFTLPHKPVKWVSFSRLGKSPRIYPYSKIRNRLTSWDQSLEA